MFSVQNESWLQTALNDINPSICATCLTRDRKLFSLAQNEHLLDVCNGVSLSKEDQVCWECKARLNTFVKFRDMAVHSRSVLMGLESLQYPSSENPDYQTTQSFSNLTSSHKNKYDFEIRHHRKKVKKEIVEATCVEDSMDMNETNYDDDCKSNIDYLSVETKKEEPIKTEYDINYDMPSTSKEIDPNLTSLFETIDFENTQIDAECGDIETLLLRVKKHEKYVKLRLLNEYEMKESRELMKNKNKYRINPLQCQLCIMGFSNKRSFDKHNLLHCVSQGDYSCPICEQRFESDETMKTHHKSHYREYQCTVCPFTNQNMYKVIEHWRMKHDEVVYCDICNAPHTKRSLKKHMTLHSDPLLCNICGHECKTPQVLKLHHMRAHEEMPLMSCRVCGKQYRGTLKLKAHMRIHLDNANENAYCAECGVQFNSVYAYRTHLQTSLKHANEHDVRFECDKCAKTFLSKVSVRRHIERVHERKSNYKCHLCEKAFYRPFALKDHIKYRHQGVPKVRDKICSVCGKAFWDSKVLSTHMLIHTGERPHACPICGLRFTQSSSVVTHVKGVHKLAYPRV